jgi:hypothetical protein
MSGTSGRPPTLTKMRSAVSASLFTSTVSGPVKRAWPWMTVAFFSPRIHFSTPPVDRATIASFLACTAAKSTRGSPSIRTP